MEPAQVGSTLIFIGLGLLGLSILMILVGHFWTSKKKKHTSFPYEETESPRPTVFPFRLRSDTKIEGKISVCEPFDLSIQDYFPGPGPSGTIFPWRWFFSTYIYLTNMKPGEHSFEVFLKPGDYQFFLNTESKKAKGSVEFTQTFYEKPLRKLIDVGLALFQVALPILITGFVIYVGLPLA